MQGDNRERRRLRIGFQNSVVRSRAHRLPAMDESRWENLTGGYRVIYDPRPALERLREAEKVTGG